MCVLEILILSPVIVAFVFALVVAMACCDLCHSGMNDEKRSELNSQPSDIVLKRTQ